MPTKAHKETATIAEKIKKESEINHKKALIKEKPIKTDKQKQQDKLNKQRQKLLQKAIETNQDCHFNPNHPETYNQGGRINVHALLSMSPEEQIQATIADMANQLIKEQQENPDDLANTKRTTAYMYNNDNKAFHLEIIKRSFLPPQLYQEPEDIQPILLQYIAHCYNYNKIPTISGFCVFSQIPYNKFKQWLKEPLNLFHDFAINTSELFHDISLNATIDGKINPNVFKLMGQKEWDYEQPTPQSSTNIFIDNSQKTDQEKLEHINALRLSSSQYEISDDTN